MAIVAEIKAFKCEICDYENGQESVLKKHIESVHKEIVLKKHIESVHKGIMEFECNLCDYKASSNSSLKKHIASIHYGNTGC